MLEKFLISIGLKQPEPVQDIVQNQQTTVRPSGENRFIDDENIFAISATPSLLGMSHALLQQQIYSFFLLLVVFF